MVLFRFPPGLTQFVEFRLQRVVAPPKRSVGGAFPAQFFVFGLLPRDELGQFVGVFVLLLVGVVVVAIVVVVVVVISLSLSFSFSLYI